MLNGLWAGFDEPKKETVRTIQPRIIVTDINTDQPTQKPQMDRTLRPPIRLLDTPQTSPQIPQSLVGSVAANGEVAGGIGNKWIVLGALALVGYLIYSNTLSPADRTVTSVTRYGRRS